MLSELRVWHFSFGTPLRLASIILHFSLLFQSGSRRKLCCLLKVVIGISIDGNGFIQNLVKSEMLNRLSTLIKNRYVTIALLVVFCVLVVSVIFVGLDDVPGYILGYLATTVVFFMITRSWQTLRRFIVLFALSFIGIIFLSFFHVEVICRLAVLIGGIAALQGSLLDTTELIITYVILFAGPVGMFFGIAGVITLGVMRLTAMRSRNSAADGT